MVIHYPSPLILLGGGAGFHMFQGVPIFGAKFSLHAAMMGGGSTPDSQVPSKPAIKRKKISFFFCMQCCLACCCCFWRTLTPWTLSPRGLFGLEAGRVPLALAPPILHCEALPCAKACKRCGCGQSRRLGRHGPVVITWLPSLPPPPLCPTNTLIKGTAQQGCLLDKEFRWTRGDLAVSGMDGCPDKHHLGVLNTGCIQLFFTCRQLVAYTEPARRSFPWKLFDGAPEPPPPKRAQPRCDGFLNLKFENSTSRVGIFAREPAALFREV